jgi:bifunctional non-homologous end joining protein LigD
MSRSSPAGEIVIVGGRTLALSNQDKPIWPGEFTKGDLVRYYRAVAPWILPHLQNRPLTLERYPNGIDGESFFEKNVSRGAPEWVRTVSVSSDSGRRSTIDFVVCDDEATLVWLANLAAIVLHIWMSHEPTLGTPDFVLFDLDPHEGCTIATLGQVALSFRDALEAIGLKPLVKTTGGKGLHVVVPLEDRYSYDEAKLFAEIVARHVHAGSPAQTTIERTIAKRPKGTVYLDYVQVGEGKTMVAPYSVRPRAKAPVSTPLGWGEVEALARKRAKDTQGPLAAYTIKNVPALLASQGDPWSGSGWKPQRLEAALRRARALWSSPPTQTSKGA